MPDTDLRQTPETDWAQRLKQQMERQDEPPAAAREPDDAQDELDSLLREQLSRLQTGSTATAAPATGYHQLCRIGPVFRAKSNLCGRRLVRLANPQFLYS